MKNKPLVYVLIILVTTIAMACSTSEKGLEPETEDTDRKAVKEEKSIENLQQILSSTRSSLRDVYSTQNHDMPKPFLMKDTTELIQSDPFDGYRVQIISTRNVELADSIKNHFSMWADTTIAGYSPKPYIFFKQPFFKVHVGDFQDRDRANVLSQIIKKKYPEAWVVFDRIDPNLVPADTVQIRLVEEDEQADSTFVKGNQ